MIRWAKRLATWVAVALLTVFVVRAVDSQRGPPLALWQTYVPQDPGVTTLDLFAWGDWLRAEDALFAGVKANVSDKLPADQCVPANRYCPTSPIYSAGFRTDWNRSFVLEPTGVPVGAVVLLHGLTDGPYSLRHVGQEYRARGWLVIGIRMPGHGTVPGALTAVTVDQWRAATRLAVREARRRVPERPLHLVGYSNGGALALDYALASLGDTALARPARVVLLSPMVRITAAARFSGLAGWPAVFPAFAKAAWLDLVPEYNPFKTSSFPVNAARESFRLTQLVQGALADRAADGSIARMPPVDTFQSVVDSTIVVAGIVNDLYARLPANGSELVLFDLNRDATFGPLLQPRAARALDGLLPPAPRRYGVTLITNAGGSDTVEARITPAGAVAARLEPLGIAWPAQMFSQSHISIPFPLSDGLYGTDPDPAEDFGVNLGALAARGEQGVLLLPPTLLMRISANPFYPYMTARIAAGMAADTGQNEPKRLPSQMTTISASSAPTTLATARSR